MARKRCDVVVKSKTTTLISPYVALNVCGVSYDFTENEKKSVEEIGFGSLIRSKIALIDKSLVLWLVDHFDPFNHTLDLHGIVYSIGLAAVERLMGLLNNGSACDDAEDTYTLNKMKTKYTLGERQIPLLPCTIYWPIKR